MTQLNVAIHPQAMLIMSNQYTRLPYDKAHKSLPAYVGLLLGSSKGTRIEVTSAFELLIESKDGELEVDQKFLDKGYQILHLQIFPNELPLGWYTCSKIDDNLRDEISKKVDEIAASYDSESRLFGEFAVSESNPNSQPLTLYSTDGSNYTPINYTYEAEPAERIAMMQLQSGGSAEDQIQFTKKAFQSLDEDLEKLQHYLEKVAKKEIPFDRERMRKAATLAQWWNHNNYEEPASDKVEEQANLALLCGLILETLSLYEKSA